MKSILGFVFTMALIFTFNCQSNDFNNINKQKLLDSLNCVIINNDSVSLSINEIYKINDILNKSIIEYNSAIDVLSNNFDPDNISHSKIYLKKYKKQLIPFFNKKNEKVIWVNCLCNEVKLGSKDNWRKTIIKVLDGGNCFFNVNINLQKNNWSDFNVNDNG